VICFQIVSLYDKQQPLILSVMATSRKIRILIGALAYFGGAVLLGGWIGFAVAVAVAIFSAAARRLIGVEAR
jgi:energy-converting hydrogenase Eha subunit G